jgi:hypothetical protein
MHCRSLTTKKQGHHGRLQKKTQTEMPMQARLFANLVLFPCALLAASIAGCTAMKGQTLSENKAAVLRSEAELWSKGNLAVAAQVYSPDFVCHFRRAIRWPYESRRQARNWASLRVSSPREGRSRFRSFTLSLPKRRIPLGASRKARSHEARRHRRTEP